MAYARIPDELCSDDRYLHAVDLHPAAGTLVLFGYSYSAREASDGFVPARQYRRWLGDREQSDAAVAALVEAGLWEAADGGHVMLDYTHAGRNITRAEWEKRREAERVRKAEWRERVNAERVAASGEEASVPEASQRDTGPTDGVTDPGQDAGRTASETQASLAREGAPADAQTQTQTQIQTRTENTATASRAGAHKPPAGGGGGVVDDEEHPQIAGARIALLAAGCDPTAGTNPSGELTAALRDRERAAQFERPDWSSFDWSSLGRWLAAERAANRCKSSKPSSVLRYGLFALAQAGTPAARRGPGTSRPPAPSSPGRDGLTIPEGTPEARSAWERLSERIGQMEDQAIADGEMRSNHRSGGWRHAVLPLRLDGGVLVVTAEQSAVAKAESHAEWWANVAAQAGLGQLRWVDRQTAAVAA